MRLRNGPAEALLATSAVLTPIVSTSSSGMPRRGKALSPMVSALRGRRAGIDVAEIDAEDGRRILARAGDGVHDGLDVGSEGAPTITTTSILPSRVRLATSPAEIVLEVDVHRLDAKRVQEFHEGGLVERRPGHDADPPAPHVGKAVEVEAGRRDGDQQVGAEERDDPRLRRQRIVEPHDRQVDVALSRAAHCCRGPRPSGPGRAAGRRGSRRASG